MAVPTSAGGATLLTPPQFRDERLSDIARIVYLVFWILIVVSALSVPFVFIGFGSVLNLGFFAANMATIWVTLLISLSAVRSGHVIAGARIMVGGIWVAGTLIILTSGGVDTSVLPVLLLPIVIAGVLLGWRETVVATVAGAVTAFGAAWAGSAGWLVAGPQEFSAWFRAGVVTTFGLAVCLLLTWSSRSLRAALSNARHAAEGLKMAGSVYDTTSEGIVVTTADGIIVDVNDAYLAIHGYYRADVIGQNPRMLKSGRHGPDFYQEMWGTLLSTGRWQGEIWDRRSDGSLVAKWLSISTVKDDDGNTTHYVGVFSDITAVRKGEEALQWLATHDPLTRLPNRALLDDRLTTALARSRRQQGVAAVFYFDLDHFKDVNDSLGHPAGDLLLVTIADKCRSVVRETDTIGRTGGDEFTVIATDYVGVEDLSARAQRLLSVIAEPVVLGGREVYVTASVGIAVYPADGADAAELVAHADVAMYRAKALGKNRFEFYSAELQDELKHRIEVETALRQALKEDRLFMAYQPQVDLRTGAIVGVEALVRWREADGAVIMPDEFIPIAEASDLILGVGDAVFRHAVADSRILFDAGYRVNMAINVAARQWMEQDVAAAVIDGIRANGLSVGDFEVEITESAMLTRTDTVAAKVRSLQAQGVRVSIDDFGTGYASMSYVMDFHPSKLKIDRSFVSGLPDSPGARAIVNATIALAGGVGATVLAEGPETAAQVQYLCEHGCDLAQGFYFCRPVPLDELLVLLGQGPLSLPD